MSEDNDEQVGGMSDEQTEDPNRHLWLAVRRGLLLIINAIESSFGLRETKDITSSDKS